ncbi:MAG: GUN4 domain-containing protein, partial [Pseudanabaenales cyanobacterium]|nr:GUN4 domain-containing protein [Pseudanabaenales cyanobacterium]
IAETVETWFRERQKDDLALLYISGHGVKDAQSDLYFAACDTRKQKEELIRATAIAASFVRDRVRESKAKRQVIILDCCFSGAFGNLLSKDDHTINLETVLGAEGRVVLTSSSSIQYSFEQRDGELSLYTHYLVEGIRTGAADANSDGAISVQDLHQYASRKVQEESPAMTPKIIVLKDEGFQIRIANAPLGDPKLKYRKEVEAIVQEDGDTIDEILSRPLLEEWRHKLGLTDPEAQTIEAEILEPIRQRQAKIERYRQIYTQAIQHKKTLGERERKRLKQLQKVLGLRDENVQSIESEVEIPPHSSSAAPSSIPPSPSTSPTLPVEQDDLDSEIRIDYTRLRDLLKAKDWKGADEETYLRLLKSEKRIDYTRLRDLLKAEDWKGADEETYLRMLEAVGRENGDYIREAELLNFPCGNLKTIDRLWVHYSQGQFGFSVQKKIYVECGAKLDGKYPGDKIWSVFCDRIGWRVNENYIS